MTISEEMREQIRELHAKGKWPGKCFDRHFPKIKKIVDTEGYKTILDYGCGKAKYHPKEWNIKKYDPGVPEFSRKPGGTYDLVICTDVLEHVEEEHIMFVLSELISFAEKGLYLCIHLGKAKQILPDGRNAHILIKSKDWWTLNIDSLKNQINPKLKIYYNWSK